VQAFCNTYHLDGVDLDWEPAWGTATVTQINNYGSLINAIKAQAPELILSAAVNPLQVPTDPNNITHAYVVPLSAVNNLDIINVMGYDLSLPDHANYTQTINALNNWASYAAPAGVSKSKFVLGVPFYARNSSGWGATMTYQQIVDTYLPPPSADDVSGWYYNGPTTMQNKSNYVLSNGYGGIMIWELSQDHFTGSQYDQTSLLPVIKNAMGLTAFTTLDGSGNLVATGDNSANTFSLSITSSTVTITLGQTTRTYPAAMVNTITVNGINQAPTLVQPADMTLNANTTADQGLTGSDPDGDALTFSKVTGPLFMTVTTLTPTTGNIHLAPASADAGNYPGNTVRASDGALSDSKSFAITVNAAANHAPTADADGPYTGTIGVPVAFDGSGSSDPDGDALTYAWDFGDASTGVGVTPSHTYVAVGLYNVTLRVTDTGGLFNDDASTANIVDQFAAYVFPQANNKIKLNTGKPQYCFQIQPVDGSYSNTDVDLSSIVRISPGTGSVDRIPATGNKTATNGDLNNDGILEIKACFNKADLRLLFSGLGGGAHTVTVALEGSLISGGTFHAELDLSVSGSNLNHGKNPAAISPNPLNPQAVLTFSTSKAGFVKVQMFDIRGRLVRTLEDTQSAPAGYHDVTIDGMNSSGVRLASGRYFVLVNTSEGTEKLSVTILK
jgi:hypothetical protein